MQRAFVLLAVLLAGCGVNPVPEPPSAPELFGGLLDGVECGPCDGEATVRGEAGATRNAEAVSAANLETTDSPVVERVRADGSFTLRLDAVAGDEIRVQALRGDLRSPPVDLLLLPSGLLRPALRPLAECFAVDAQVAFPARRVGQAASETIRIRHTCAEPLEVASIAFRAPAVDFGLATQPVPLTLEPGGHVDVRVDFAPTTAGVHEAIVNVEVTLPSRDRRAVTLFGRGTP